MSIFSIRHDWPVSLTRGWLPRGTGKPLTSCCCCRCCWCCCCSKMLIMVMRYHDDNIVQTGVWAEGRTEPPRTSPLRQPVAFWQGAWGNCPPPLNFILLKNVSCSRKLSSTDIKFGANNPPFGGNVRAKFTFWAPIHPVLKLQLSVGKLQISASPLSPTFLTHDVDSNPLLLTVGHNATT